MQRRGTVGLFFKSSATAACFAVIMPSSPEAAFVLHFSYAHSFFFEMFKALVIGIVEGISEWLPVSSTGHMLIVDAFLPMNMSAEFKSLFLSSFSLPRFVR